MNYDAQAPSIKDIAEKTREYIDTMLELAKLKAISKASSIASALISMIVLPLLILVVIVLLSIGFSFWLGRILGAYHYGFFITGAFLSLVIVLIYIFRQKLLKKPVANSLIENILK